MQTDFSNNIIFRWCAGICLITSSLFFLTAPVTLQPSLQVNEVHAQESLTSAIGSGLGKGIVQCLGNFVVQFLLPQAVGKVAGASFLNPVGIPAFTDLGSQISQGQQAFTEFLREGCLDAIAFFIAQDILDMLANDTLAWVNSGFTKFGRSGNSAFVGDLEGFFAGVADQEYNKFLDEVQRAGPGNPLNGVCEAFQPDIVREVSNQYFANNQEPSGVQPTPFSSSTEIAASGCENLTRSVGTGTVQNFIDGDFKQGGWQAFEHTLANPNANPVSAFLEKNKQLKARVRQAGNINREKLQRGNGYVSAIACPQGNLSTSTQQCVSPDGERYDPVVKTPGSIVNKQLNRVVGSGQRQLELADEVNEIVAALVDQLIGKITGTGAESGPGGVFSEAAQSTSFSADLEEYSQSGYTGGFQADYTSTTLTNQIQTEQGLRSAVENLPSTNEIDRVRTRAKQCLRENKLDGPGEIESVEVLIAQLNAVEKSVFPPARGTREAQETDDILREIEENPNQPIDTSTTTQSGAQKTNWVGNKLDWERGKIYGQELCEQGETKYPLAGKGTGNLSFTYSNGESEWLGFVCGLEGFDDPTTGSDSIHVELYPFVEFFDRASDFTRGNPNGTSTGSNPVTASDTENIPVNIERYISQSGYRSNTPPNKVKVDWTGADFDWKYYNLFADTDQMMRINDGLQKYEDGSYRYQLDFKTAGGNSHRYGSQTCREQTKGSISWIIKPDTEQWIQQKCVEDKNGDWTGWAFFNTGETRPAYRTIETQPDSFQELIAEINTLIGDTNYDDLYTAPRFEEDNLRELKHDLNTIDGDVGGDESINDRRQVIDERFGQMENRFHSEKDIEAASNALNELDPNQQDSIASKLQSVASQHNCQLPADYEPPADDPTDSQENENPVAQNDFFTGTNTETLVVSPPGVISNDSDPDGDALTVDPQTVGPAQNGRFNSFNDDGSFTYTPNENYTGTWSFTYQLEDEARNTDTGTVSVTITDSGDNSNQPNIETFEIQRTGATDNLIEVSWQAEAETCQAVNSPRLDSWSGQSLPPSGTRVYQYNQARPISLTIACTSSAGQTTNQTAVLGGNLR